MIEISKVLQLVRLKNGITSSPIINGGNIPNDKRRIFFQKATMFTNLFLCK